MELRTMQEAAEAMVSLSTMPAMDFTQEMAQMASQLSGVIEAINLIVNSDDPPTDMQKVALVKALLSGFMEGCGNLEDWIGFASHSGKAAVLQHTAIVYATIGATVSMQLAGMNGGDDEADEA